MTLHYFSNSRIPTEKAHGIQIMNMAEAFSLQNTEVELILPTRKNLPELKNINPFNYYGVEERFKIKKIFSPDPNFLMLLPNGIYIKIQSFLFILSLFFYLLFLKNKKDCIFYTRDEYLLPVLQKFSSHVVWEAHTLPKNIQHYLKYWHRCHKIITITESLKKELINFGLDENKILVASDGVKISSLHSVIPSGAERSRGISSLRQKLSLPLDKKIILYTGHLYTWKGVDTILVTAKLYQSNYQLLFVFVGGTEYDIKNFKQKAVGLNNVLILGHKPPQEISEYLQCADVLVLPNSKKDEKASWTSPLKLFEYMASGVPIVATNLPVIKEVLNENNALLVEPDNPESLKTGIETILTNPELASKLASQAKFDVEQYAWTKRAKKIIQFIQ